MDNFADFASAARPPTSADYLLLFQLLAMLFQLLFLLIAACSAQALPAGSPKKPGMPGVTPSSKMADLSVLGKLRQEMVQWYCPDGAHADEPPCKVYSFLQKLKVRPPPPRPPILAPRLLPPPFLTAHRTATATQAEKDPEKKKAMLSARQAELKAVTPEAKAEQGKKAKAAYSSMYKSFCADATKSSSAVCSNAVLKNIYGK